MAVTITSDTRKRLLQHAVYAAQLAAEEIRKIYQMGQYEVNMRSDLAPVTIADRKAHDIIKRTLMPTRIPLLSEDGREFHYDERQAWDLLWMVDPLDGTREFVKNSTEFTVNIALIENNKPTVGVVLLPEMHTLYFAIEGMGAYRWSETTFAGGFDECEYSRLTTHANRLPLPARERKYTLLMSRSNASNDKDRYISQYKKLHPDMADKPEKKGSSWKMCLVAEDSADAYPRLSQTSEWDIAAGQIIVEEAGRHVVDLNTFEPLRYNKVNLVNPPFIVKHPEDKLVPPYGKKKKRSFL